ncbi:aminopeptidase P family protein, partial [Bacteroidota bacterium]
MMRYEQINPELFNQNRKKLAEKLLPNSIAILNSNDQFPKNGDQYHRFCQNSDLFWASGLDQEKTVVLLYPDSPIPKYREVAFILKSNEHIATWDGKKYSPQEASEVSGIKTVLYLDDYDYVLHEVMTYCDTVYLNAIEFYKFKPEVPYRDLRFAKQLKNDYPLHAYKRLAPLIVPLRLTKSDIEIQLIKKAVGITSKAFNRVLKFTESGKMEYEIQAEIDHEFTINRASGHSYEPIIASGKNALCLHYIKNNDTCMDGDLILFDFGAEYAGYASDLSRTIPVNGKFTARQRQVYESVLHVYKKAISMMVIGTTINELNTKVGKLLEAEMIKLGLFTEEDVKNQDAGKPLYTKYFMHGNSHFIGLDVHDVGLKHTVFEEGMVLSCEPGLYIAE